MRTAFNGFGLCDLKIFVKIGENIFHYAMFWHIVGVALFRITK